MTRLLALLTLLIAAPLAARTPPSAHPALWKVASPTTTIYLFGTVHLLPKGVDWFEGPVRRAFDASDTLVTEVPMPDAAAIRPFLMKLALATDGRTLRDRLPAETRTAYERALEKFGMKPDVFDRFRPWFGSLELAELEYEGNGMGAADGVEQALDAAATSAHKAKLGLETAEQQLTMLASPSDAEQIDFLGEDLKTLDDSSRELREIVADWTGGRPADLARVINKDLDKEPKLKKLLIDDRNARWADWIAERLKRPGTVFIAVGAGHVSGAQGSVQALLAKRGITARRVQ